MVVATKIRLIPTKQQEELFWKSAGTARWAFNFFLRESEMWYKDTGKTLKESEARKFINNTLKPNTHQWLKEVGSNVMKQAVKDADEARKRFFKGIADYPKLKSRHKSKPSFYVNYESLRRTLNGFQGEKIGRVKTAQPLPKLKNGQKYSNPRISFDGRNWFLSVGYEIELKEVELTGESIGIDVGVKDLAIASNLDKPIKNINKSREVRRLEKKLKREQRKLSRKMEANIKSYTKNRKPIWKRPIRECKNIQKQRAVINNLHKRLVNIRNNHLHQATNKIVKTKPSRIVMETLNVKGMMKNKHLAKAVAKQKLYEFKRQIQYKSQKYGIEFVEADMWFPSSKTCSCCGTVKSILKLSERTFQCECGFSMDRDKNASINLANYSI